jgi:hypothetical protein
MTHALARFCAVARVGGRNQSAIRVLLFEADHRHRARILERAAETAAFWFLGDRSLTPTPATAGRSIWSGMARCTYRSVAGEFHSSCPADNAARSFLGVVRA